MIESKSVADRYWEAVRQTADSRNGHGGSALLVELLADVSHAIWASWMSWQLSCGIFNDDGTWTMPVEKLERWTRQMRTPYDQLTEKEKDSDREQVDRILKALHKAGYTVREAPRWSISNIFALDDADVHVDCLVEAAPVPTVPEVDFNALGIQSPVYQLTPDPNDPTVTWLLCEDGAKYRARDLFAADPEIVKVDVELITLVRHGEHIDAQAEGDHSRPLVVDTSDLMRAWDAYRRDPATWEPNSAQKSTPVAPDPEPKSNGWASIQTDSMNFTSTDEGAHWELTSLDGLKPGVRVELPFIQRLLHSEGFRNAVIKVVERDIMTALEGDGK